MSRTISSQLKYACIRSRAYGQKKYDARKNGTSKDKTFSHKAMETRLKTAGELGKYVQEHYPDCRWVRDITPQMVNKFLNAKADRGCRQATLNTAASDCRFLERACQSAFPSFKGFNPKDLKTPQERSELVRPSYREPEGMTRSDFDLLKAFVPQNGNVAKAMAIGEATGARAEGICKLRGSDIHINGNTATVDIHGEKGGRDRTVEVVKPEHVQNLRDLKDQAGENYIIQNQKRGGFLKPESLQRAFNRALEKVKTEKTYKGTSTHAIRKLYANERYHAYRGDHSKYDTIRYINTQLGHGADRDVALLGKYVDYID